MCSSLHLSHYFHSFYGQFRTHVAFYNILSHNTPCELRGKNKRACTTLVSTGVQYIYCLIPPITHSPLSIKVTQVLIDEINNSKTYVRVITPVPEGPVYLLLRSASIACQHILHRGDYSPNAYIILS